jgi:predicted dehydrogenase
MNGRVSITLCGAGGWGESYLKPLLTGAGAGKWSLVSVVDPHPENSSLFGALREQRVPVFSSLDEALRKYPSDLTILASPIHVHAEQTCLALERESHVLCEKPLCVGLGDWNAMERAEKASGKTVTVGYQWSFSDAIQQFKTDCLAGRFGAARRLRTLVLWPRDEAYYQRNKWAGKQWLESGHAVFDSPVNNAASHFLHNMFYVLGASPDESAMPKRVQAELWRANAIENYDTAALRIDVDSGAELFFYTSHANDSSDTLSFLYEFECGTVRYDLKQDRLIATFATGETLDYGSPQADPDRKLWAAIESARSGKKPLCGLAAARAHVACVEMAQQSSSGIHDFPGSAVCTQNEGGTTSRYVKGLQEIFVRAYSQPDGFDALSSIMDKAYDRLNPALIHL